MKHLLSAALLFLAACSGGGGTTLPPITSARPGVVAFSSNWTAPLGAFSYCGGDLSSPFGCNLPAGAVWGVLDQPGNGGAGCVDPEPNVCFQPANDVLGYSNSGLGMALVSAQTFSNAAPISIEVVVTPRDDCATGIVSYVGGVLYDGEGAAGNPSGNYRALYLSCDSVNMQAWLYGPTYAGPIGATVYAQGDTHALRIDWVPGVSFTYLVDDIPILVETPNSLSSDPFVFNQRPHFGIWFGSTVGTIGRADVFTG